MPKAPTCPICGEEAAKVRVVKMTVSIPHEGSMNYPQASMKEAKKFASFVRKNEPTARIKVGSKPEWVSAKWYMKQREAAEKDAGRK